MSYTSPKIPSATSRTSPTSATRQRPSRTYKGSPRANIVFLMNPCRVTQVRDIAFAGEVMPQKSTDFYPKLLSGLTVYALD